MIFLSASVKSLPQLLEDDSHIVLDGHVILLMDLSLHILQKYLKEGICIYICVCVNTFAVKVSNFMLHSNPIPLILRSMGTTSYLVLKVTTV